MAQLTLSERTQLANDPRFQQRLASAIKKKANFFKDQTYATITNQATGQAAADFHNAATQKRKRFATQVLKNSYVDQILKQFAEFFMTQYNEDIDSENPQNDGNNGTPGPAGAGNRKETPGDPFNAQGNQLADFELTDSAASDAAYNYFAGVDGTDATEKIDW